MNALSQTQDEEQMMKQFQENLKHQFNSASLHGGMPLTQGFMNINQVQSVPPAGTEPPAGGISNNNIFMSQNSNNVREKIQRLKKGGNKKSIR